MPPGEPVVEETINGTALRHVRIAFRGGTRVAALKLEEQGPTGSVKDRTAAGLLRRLHQDRPLVPGTVVVESTSGNLGLALARILRSLGCSFVAVVDPKTPHSTRSALLEGGARLIVVDEPDGRGGYLLHRLDTVRRLCARNPGHRWPNQYENWANPQIHTSTTGPEIAEQAGTALSAVYVPVSTGGTFAGVAAYMAAARPRVACVAVDVTGSAAMTGGRTGRRLIPGIGAGRRSSFLPAAGTFRRRLVDDVEAIAVCRILRADLGLALGGSSGCTVRALLADLAAERATGTLAGRPGGLPVCLAADGGAKYADTLYSDRWAAEQGIAAELGRAIRLLRGQGLAFSNAPDYP
ncbi:pyridoxal-phosphate dependent enzyme [Actinomadura roseirufa]|uniref:pyridoxal-phosphate dependent enzyme n=1 Tax=Actinomadura roseirufa TaxID=2094049 RepID=UPI001041498E|nr:pyridoxal-phosphate dependent enzyme [Actinomadura roseirufa]